MNNVNVIAFFVSLLVFLCGLTISGAEFRLLVIHNNDMHSRFEETNAYGGPCKRNQCYGGFARMKTAIEKAKEEANKDGIPHVVLNAGDTFQGTPYFDSMKWLVVQPLLESLSIDAMTLGNHEFDLGIDHLSEYIKHVKIPVVCCNLNLTTEPRLDVPNLKPSIVLNVNGTKIGVIGFLTPSTLSPKTENLQIDDEIASIRAEARRLRENGVKIIIGLGHSGIDREIEIAGEIAELSLVIGGHSHSLLYTPKDKRPSVDTPRESYPFMVTQKSGKKVPYVQAGAFTKYLGKLMLVFDNDGNVLSATGNTEILDWTIPEDLELKKLINLKTASQRPSLKMVKGYTRVPLLLADFKNHQYESNLANLITDAMVDYEVRRYNQNYSDKSWTSASISFMNAEAIRAQIEDTGPITMEDVIMVVPFAEDKIFRVQYNGSVIKKALERSVELIAPEYILHYLYFSGLRVTYDLTKSVGNRVVSVEVLCSNCSIPLYEVLQDNKTYSVLISDYLINGGGDGFPMFKEGKTNAVSLGRASIAMVLDYIERQQIIYAGFDGRIRVKGSQ